MAIPVSNPSISSGIKEMPVVEKLEEYKCGEIILELERTYSIMSYFSLLGISQLKNIF